MKKKFQKIISLLLCAIMAFGAVIACSSGLVSLTASADGETVKYDFDETTGTLTISGTGEITYDKVEEYENIKKVEIKDGITSIGSCAFDGCASLTSITIPDSVTSIGQCAFYGCTGLTSITIPDSVTSIGYYSFSGCTSLKNIVIGDNVTEINSSTFDNTAYYNNEDNWQGGVLYIGNCLIEAKDTISGAYKIKDGTKAIADSAFLNCKGLTSITIPDSVTSIGGSAFYNCTGLTSITIPDSVASIEHCVFLGCSSLSEINYLGCEGQWNNIDIGWLYNAPLFSASKIFADHDFSNEKIKNKAGLFTEGTKEYECSNDGCSATRTETIPSIFTSAINKILDFFKNIFSFKF